MHVSIYIYICTYIFFADIGTDFDTGIDKHGYRYTYGYTYM